MHLAKKNQFHFSFFNVHSQNPKFNLEYLKTISRATAAGKVEYKAIPEDWTELKIANWGLNDHS